MDPFSSSRIPADCATGPHAGPARSQGPQTSAAGLRRSAGLFNLKLRPDASSAANENVADEQFTPEQSRPPLPAMYPPMFTPDTTSNTSALVGSESAQKPAASSRRRGTLSLKRPHPFSSTKPPTKSGFLARSSTNRPHDSSPQGSSPQSGLGRKPLVSNPKRLHLTRDDSLSLGPADARAALGADGAMTPELSFRGARPVQTAFASSGLQSKRAVSMQSPKPRVPETPCKRPVASTGDISSLHMGDTSARQFPPFFIGGEDLNEEASPLKSSSKMTLPSGEDSPLLSHSKNSFAKSPSNGKGSAPVDRMERFSLEQLANSGEHDTSGGAGADSTRLNIDGHIPMCGSSTESLEPPETPTRFGDLHTSTPLASLDFKDHRISRQASEAVTVTPGTAVRAPQSLRSQAHTNSNMLRTIDPADSMSLSPPESLDIDTFSISNSSPSDGSLSSPRTPDVRGSRRRALLLDTQGMTATGPLIASTSTESQSSPQPRRRARGMRFFGLNGTGQGSAEGSAEKMPPPPPPPIRVETPLGGAHSAEPRTPGHGAYHTLFDQLLTNRFDLVQGVAVGEFSAVFVVTQGKTRYAVKKTKKPLLGQRERARRLEEVNILRRLQRQTTSGTLVGSQDDDAAEHVVHLYDEWESEGFGYIMTEYCENGDLNQFLAAQGRVSRLEEWRVWKILVELTLGLAYIHEQDVLHLDLKPANVFVTFEGHLKIGDFGMATTFPVAPGFEREGDREYIAPEILEKQQYGKPADVFSMGLMMVEIAANIVLPDNGVHWHRLRSGDLTDAGRLSSGDLAGCTSGASGRNAPPPWAPPFLVNKSYALDVIVTAMLNPQPEKRPTVETLLEMPELLLVNARGQAGAIVYEGEYGPAPDDPEVTNVWQRT